MGYQCPKCGHDRVQSKGEYRRQCRACNYSFSIRTKMQQLKDDSFKAAPFVQDRYVITAAVNNTPVHPAFFASLRAYCVANKARLIVVPLQYKNPTSRAEETKEDNKIWYAMEVIPYLYRGRAQLADTLSLVADVSTQPTASRSLSGLATFGGKSSRDSVIFAHPRISMQTVATQAGKLAKWATTTGACTLAEYSDSTAGAKGEFHHSFAALSVEVDGDRFHLRHLKAHKSTGAFCDLDKRYDGDEITQVEAKVLVCGDLHAVRADPCALEATFFAPGSMVDVLKPAHIVLHDVLDFQSASHHNNWITKFKLFHEGKSSVSGELVATCALLSRIIDAAPEFTQFYIVDSNHNRHFNRWLGGTTGGDDQQNALTFFETKVAWMKAVLAKQRFDPFEWWATKLLSPEKRARVTFLDANTSLTFDDVEYGIHGDRGANGSRGSREGFTKVGTKMVVGHAHSPGEEDGVIQVGTLSDLQLDYNDGFSGWLHTNCVAYDGGKRVSLTSVNGVWRKV